MTDKMIAITFRTTKKQLKKIEEIKKWMDDYVIERGFQTRYTNSDVIRIAIEYYYQENIKKEK